MSKPTILALSLVAAVPVPACAQATQEPAATDSGLAEIIVTATKRSENLQDVPLSVSAVGGEQLARRGIVQTNDIAALVPNLQINTQYGDTQPNFTLRGVGVANEFNVNTASPVGVYVDEVYQAFRFTHGQQLFDIDRLEVLRGPQGTLFGRNTTGGAISIITQKPSLHGESGYLSAGYGNFNRYKVDGAYEVTPVEGKVGLRAAFTRSYGDGYYREANPATSFNHETRYQSSDSVAGRVELRVKPSDQWDILAKVFYGRDNPIGPARYIVPYPGPTDIAGYSRFARGLSQDEFEMNEMGHFYTRNAGGSLTVNWTSGKLGLTSITGYSDGRLRLHDETDGTPNSLVNINYASDTTDFNQDARFSYTDTKLKLIVGGYYGKDTLKSVNPLRFYDSLFPDATSLANLNPAGLFSKTLPPTSFNDLQSYRQIRRSVAVYSEGEYAVTDRLGLTLGLRYTSDKISYKDGSSVLYTNFPGTPLLPIFSNINNEAKSGKVSGRAILNYKVADHVSTYASFSRGYRSGTYNGFAYADPSQIYFVPPEQLDSYELGIKSRFFNNKLQVNAAAFYYDYKNQQVSEIVGAVAFLRSANATVKGAEAEILAKPVRAVTLRGSVGYLDSRYKDKLISGKNIGGNELPFASRWTWNVGGDVDLYRNAGTTLILNGELQYTGKYYFDLFGNQSPGGLLKQNGYTLANARLTLGHNPWSVALWGKNLTDKRFYTVGYDLVSGFGQLMFVPGAPRTYGIEGTVRF